MVNAAMKMHLHCAQAAPTIQDIPPCDGCLQLFCGTMVCAQCRSAFYCCRDCQASHWKSKHKDECAVLQRLNEAKAQKVLGKFFEDRHTWKLLDKTGAYKAAVRQGLHDKIRKALERDRDTVHDRYRAGQAEICDTHLVMFELFRAKRADGNNRNYCGMDGQRIKAYVTSHPDALLPWFHASTQLLVALLDVEVAKNSAAHSILTKVADEVWKGWVDVFASPVAARAILLPLPTLFLDSKDGSRQPPPARPIPASTRRRSGSAMPGSTTRRRSS